MLSETRSCPVCGQQQSQTLYQPKVAPGPVARCQNCRMVYVATVQQTQALIVDGPVLAGLNHEVLTSERLDDVNDAWEMQQLAAKEHEWAALRHNAVDALQRVRQAIPGLQSGGEQPKLLDFGCGWGFFIRAAQEQGWVCSGLEPLPACAVYARSRTGAKIITDTLRVNSFPSGSFDLVTSFQVFEHLPDPLGDAAKLFHMIRPGGAIVIEVPNISTWSVSLLGKYHRHFVQDHLNFFSARTLGRLLSKVGFEPVAAYYPGRTMTIRHLVDDWGGRMLPGYAARTLSSFVERANLRERTLSLNLGDIVAVIARKPLETRVTH